jgi:hypothetical protein
MTNHALTPRQGTRSDPWSRAQACAVEEQNSRHKVKTPPPDPARLQETNSNQGANDQCRSTPSPPVGYRRFSRSDS